MPFGYGYGYYPNGYGYRYYPGYNYHYAYNLPDPYMMIILILIVLQWTRIPTYYNPNDLTDNGGLFIITLFILACCSMANRDAYYSSLYYRRPYRRGFFF